MMTVKKIEKQLQQDKRMQHSIRHRIMLIYVGLMVATILAILVVNNWWLERYYVNQKLKVMEEAYNTVNHKVMEEAQDGESISSVISRELEAEWQQWGQMPFDENGEDADTQTDDSENSRSFRSYWKQKKKNQTATNSDQDNDTILRTIRTFGERNNLTTVLIDSSTGKAFLSSGRESDFLAQKVQRYVLGKGGGDAQILKEHDNYIVETNYDKRSNASYMEAWGFFSDNSTLFIMSMPLAGIHDSVMLANRFTTFVGFVALILGTIIMYFVANRVIKPVLALAALSEKMSNLDFDAHYEADAQDEIGILGRNMNNLSSRLKDAIGALQDANRQLQHDIDEKTQIDEMRKEFIANVSHELKTPIALIQGYAEGLTEGMCEDEESRNYYCEVIMDEAGKMNKMVKQLLTLTALEFGNDAPSMDTFDITELIQDLIRSSSILIQQNEATVCYQPDGPCMVFADEFKIEEVVTNYLTNAIHHLDGERRIEIRVEKIGETVKVTVFNTGNPIPEADLPNLWTKFYKVDKARTRAYGGSGIGLSIVKAIMDIHHQSCGVVNVEGGVEFWFTLQAQK
ncbi:MAG: HAMP domain-containing sensor histidine kinase [Lachnospiraceae bacterium]